MSFLYIVARSVIAAVLLAAPATAGAHAYLDASSPSDGASVLAPSEISLRFTENIEPEFSTLVVKDSRGTKVGTGTPRQPAANALAVELAPLQPGAYTVEWRVLSVDTHITDGVVRFTVVPRGR